MSETPFMAQRRKLQELNGKQTITERTAEEDAADAARPVIKKKAKKKKASG